MVNMPTEQEIIREEERIQKEKEGKLLNRIEKLEGVIFDWAQYIHLPIPISYKEYNAPSLGKVELSNKEEKHEWTLTIEFGKKEHCCYRRCSICGKREILDISKFIYKVNIPSMGDAIYNVDGSGLAEHTHKWESMTDESGVRYKMCIECGIKELV